MGYLPNLLVIRPGKKSMRAAKSVELNAKNPLIESRSRSKSGPIHVVGSPKMGSVPRTHPLGLFVAVEFADVVVLDEEIPVDEGFVADEDFPADEAYGADEA